MYGYDTNLYIGYLHGQLIHVTPHAIKWMATETDTTCKGKLTAIFRYKDTICVYSACSKYQIIGDRIVHQNALPPCYATTYNGYKITAFDNGVQVYRNNKLVVEYPTRNYGYNINDLYLDTRNNLFWSTNEGLTITNLYNRRQHKLFPNLRITSVKQDISGNYWVTTIGNGIFCINEALDDIKKIENIESYKVIKTKQEQLFFIKNNTLSALQDSFPAIHKLHLPFLDKYTPLYVDKDFALYREESSNSMYLYQFATSRYTTYDNVTARTVYVYNDKLITVTIQAINIFRLDRLKLSAYKTAYTGKVSSDYFLNGHLYFTGGKYLYVYNVDSNTLTKIDSFKHIFEVANIFCDRGKLMVFTKGGSVFTYCLATNRRCDVMHFPLTINEVAKIDNAYILNTSEGYYLYPFKKLFPLKIYYPFRQSDILFLYPRANGIISNIGGTLYYCNQQLLNKKNDTPTFSVNKVSIAGQNYYNDNITVYNSTSCNAAIDMNTLYFSNVSSFYQYRISHESEILTNWTAYKGNIIDILLNKPGLYEIEIRSVGSNDIISKPKVIHLTLSPPFYRSNIFYTSTIFSFFLAALYGFQVVSRRRKQKFMSELNYMQMEHRAINSLLNPHFIFNAINNIQSLINANSPVLANNYLVTLSRMIRQNIDNLQFNLIQVGKELNLVRNYVELQNLRFNNKIGIAIRHDINADAVYIPPLLIHTFVENAIVHGFPNEMDGFIITIELTLSVDNYLIIVVTDNGKGYYPGNHLNEEKSSLGIRFTQHRLDRLSEFCGVKFDLAIINLTGNKRQGTEVTIVIYAGLLNLLPNAII
ncbi:MAG: histidine kinase [Flavipsychrobacter sp.]|nr:histidine kinase [Flavipsychrobacter sp.]